MKALASVRGVVVHGKGLGRTLGFPTANLRITDAPDIQRGVYAAFACVEGQRYPAVVNVGHHPTVPDGIPAIEAHLEGYRGDLYGKELTLSLVRYLRPERTFDSLDALAAQLEKDVQFLREIVAGAE